RPMEEKRRQSQHVVPVEVGEKDRLDRARIEAQPVHVGEQRRPTVEQQPAFDHYGAVVPLHGEGGPGAQEGQFHPERVLVRKDRRPSRRSSGLSSQGTWPTPASSRNWASGSRDATSCGPLRGTGSPSPRTTRAGTAILASRTRGSRPANVRSHSATSARLTASFRGQR